MEVIGRAKQDARAESRVGKREAYTPQGGIERNPWGTKTEVGRRCRSDSFILFLLICLLILSITSLHM